MHSESWMSCWKSTERCTGYERAITFRVEVILPDLASGQ